MNRLVSELRSIERTYKDTHYHFRGGLLIDDLARDSADALEELQAELKRYQEWVNDLQSGMYVNCVYCGHRYGPEDEVPASMADVLKQHIEQCPEHPMSILKTKLEQVKAERDRAVECINQTENYLRALESATDYIKPGTGVWHTVGKALHDVQKWRRKEGD